MGLEQHPLIESLFLKPIRLIFPTTNAFLELCVFLALCYSLTLQFSAILVINGSFIFEIFVIN